MAIGSCRTLEVFLLTAVGMATRLIWRPRPRSFRMVLGFLSVHLVAVAVMIAFLIRDPAENVDGLRTFAWIAGGLAVLGSLTNFLFNTVLPRLGATIPDIAQDALVLGLSVVSVIAIAARSGISLSGITVPSAVATAAVGLALQDVISNFAGGVALQFDRLLQVGSWLQINDLTGKVVTMGWRHTALETPNGDTLLIPNAQLMKTQVSILGSAGGQEGPSRRWIYFKVRWDQQPSDVASIVVSAVASAELSHVDKAHRPSCVLMDLVGESGHYGLRYWITDLSACEATDSSVRNCIYFALQRGGMQLASGATASPSPGEAEACSPSHRVELLNRFELFRSLTADEKESLAKQFTYSPFAQGDVLTAEGATAHCLYIIEKGRVSLRVSNGKSGSEFAVLTGPAFVGEYSLLTGEPRSATVVALSNVSCYRLDKGAVNSILEGRPELAQELAAVMAQRQASLLAARSELGLLNSREQQAKSAATILRQIKAWFTLE